MKQLSKNWLVEDNIPSIVWQTTLPMFGAIFALLAYDLLESSLIALSGSQVLTALGFTLPITIAMTAVVIGMSIITNNRIVKSACLKEEKLAQDIVLSLLQVSFFIVIASVIFYLANEFIFTLLGSYTWSSGHLGDPKISITNSQIFYIESRYFTWLFLAIIWQVNAVFRALGQTKIAAKIMFLWLVTKSAIAILLLTPNSSFYLPELTGLVWVHSGVDVVFAVISLVVLFNNILLTWPSKPELKTALFSSKPSSVLIIFQQLVTPISIALLTVVAAKINYDYVAAFAFIFRLESLLLLLPMMLTTTMPCIVGTNYWLAKHNRVKQAFVTAFSAIVIVQSVLALILVVNKDLLSYFICAETSAAKLLVIYLTWVPIGYVGAGVAIVYQSCLNAQGKPLQAFLLGVVHRIVLLLPIVILGALMATQASLFQALMLGHLSAGLAVIYLMRKNKDFQKNSNLDAIQTEQSLHVSNSSEHAR